MRLNRNQQSENEEEDSAEECTPGEKTRRVGEHKKWRQHRFEMRFKLANLEVETCGDMGSMGP
jgi:hypothetical protein